MKKYRLVYYLRNQSKLFSDPKVFETDSFEKFKKAFEIAIENGYEVVDVETVIVG